MRRGERGGVGGQMGRQPRGAYSIVTVRVSKASQEPRRGLERGTVDPSEDCVHVPLVPCRRCRSLVGRGFGQRRSVLPQRVFTPRIGVCCFTFYRHQHRRLYFTVLHLSFTSVGVCTSAVCTRPMTERTVGSTARNDERLHVSLAGRSLFAICSGRVGFRTPPDVRP